MKTLLIKKELKKKDVFIGCAAVADFRMKKISEKKIKKSSDQSLSLELVLNADILEFVGHSKDRPKLVIGFAAESSDLIKNAKEKLIKKILNNEK